MLATGAALVLAALQLTGSLSTRRPDPDGASHGPPGKSRTAV
jgi:hypothetical protein